MHPDAEIELVEGSRGDFIVKFGDTVLWDKQATGTFPSAQHILEELG